MRCDPTVTDSAGGRTSFACVLTSCVSKRTSGCTTTRPAFSRFVYNTFLKRSSSSSTTPGAAAGAYSSAVTSQEAWTKLRRIFCRDE